MIQSGSANCPLGGSADPVADGGPVVDPGHAASNQSLECPESCSLRLAVVMKVRGSWPFVVFIAGILRQECCPIPYRPGASRACMYSCG
jgi:hypothetical protein